MAIVLISAWEPSKMAEDSHLLARRPVAISPIIAKSELARVSQTGIRPPPQFETALSWAIMPSTIALPPAPFALLTVRDHSRHLATTSSAHLEMIVRGLSTGIRVTVWD